jgi:AsmA protein
MKRLFKMILTLTTSLIALLLIAILIIVFVIDLNDYKPQIANLVEQQIGRTLTIEGDIHLTFYPWLGFQLGKVSLGNASGFEQPEFAKFEQAQAMIKVLPLFKKQIEISTVLLEGAEINLTRKADGKTNWEDLAKLGGKSEEKPKQEGVGIKSVKINGLDLNKTKIVFNDQQNGSHYLLSDVTLKTSALLLNEPIKLQFNAALAISGEMKLAGQVNLDTKITLNLENQQYRIEPLQFTASVQGDKIPDGKQSLSINTQLININLKQKTLALSGVIAKVMESILSTEMHISYKKKPSISGKLKLTDFKLAKLLNQLGLYKMPAILQKDISFETQFEGNPAAFQFKNTQLSLDGNDLKTALLNLDLNDQTLWTKQFSLDAFGAKLTGGLNLESLFSQPSLKGKIKLGDFNLKKLLKGLEQAELVSAIPNDLPFNRAALELDFQFSQKTNKVSFEKIGLRLDDYQFRTPKMKLDIEEQTLDSEHFFFNILGMNLTGKAHFKQVFSRPIGQAELAIAPFNPKKILKLPFTRAALQSHLTLTPEAIILKNLHITADKHQLKSQNLTFNFSTDSLSSKQFLITAFGARVNGQLSAAHISNAQKRSFKGKVRFAQFNPRQLLEGLGQTVPKTSDPSALRTATLETNLQGNASELRLDKFKMRLDNSELIGQFRLKNFKKPAIAFNLNVDKIDINRYLAPTLKPTKLNQYNQAPTTALSGKDIQLPLEMLRALNINGELKIGQLKAAQLTINKLELNVSAKKGKIRITPKAQLYEGEYQGNLILNAENNPPHLIIEQTLKNVQSKALFKDLTGKEKIAGIANISTQLSTKTIKPLENLTGTISFSFKEGAIKGFNIKHSLLQPQTLVGTALPYDETIETKFGDLRGTFQLENGTLYTKDFFLKSQQVDINGKGSLKLSNNNLRFDLNTTIINPKSKKLQFLKGVIIPFQIIGKLNSPALYVDKAILLKQAKKNAIGKIKDKLFEKHHVNGKMQDFLNDLTIDDLLYK